MIRDWLRTMFPQRRLTPSEGDIRGAQELYRQVFGSQAGRELIEFWIEQIVFSNPRSTDPNECIRYAAQCAFVEDIVKALDKADHPQKYQTVEKIQLSKFDVRNWRAA